MKEYLIAELSKLTLLQITGYVIVLVGLFCWYGFMIWKRKEIFDDFRGSDGWQFWDGVAVFWITFAPIILVGHLFGVPVSSEISMKDIWNFMEWVFIVAVAGKSSKALLEARFGTSQTPDVTKTKVEITKTETKTDPKKEDKNDESNN